MGVPNLPKFRVPVLVSHRTYREVSGTGIDFVPNLPKCRVPVSSPYRTNTGTPGIVVEGIPVRGVQMSGRTELTEVSGTGIEVVPNLPKCRVPVLRLYRTTPVGKIPPEYPYPGVGYRY